MPAKKSATPTPAISAAERPFLTAIAGDLRNHPLLAVYADWLEEQADPRAATVRAYADAVSSLTKATKLPDFSPFAPQWTTMLGVPLMAGIIKLKLTAVKDSVLQLAKPIVTMETKPTKENLLAVGASKFGGHPDLPAIVQWPACTEGPLGFLGQIAMGDLQLTQIARELPKDGLLSFFGYQSFESGQQPGMSKDDLQVLYTPPAQALERRKPPKDIDTEGNGILPSCRLTFAEAWDLPCIRDRVPGPLALALKNVMKHDPEDKLSELRDRCHSFGHHLMGYSLHLSMLDDPSPGPNWTHLLCLGSDQNLDWSWCDGGRLAVYVHEADLRKSTFRRVFACAS